MSSVAMALSSFGRSYTPGSLNSWLNSHGGYVSGDLIVWGAVSSLGMSVNSISYSMSSGKLADLVHKCHPVIANVRGGSHWVLVTGTTSSSSVFRVNDPGFDQGTYSLSEMSEFVVYNPIGSGLEDFNTTLQTEAQQQVALLPDATNIASEEELGGTTCGGNCPSGDCRGCPCGTAPAYQSIDHYCSQYGWNQACCKCIMSHESSGNAHAANYNSNGSVDVGIFQINSINWGCNSGHAPCDPNANLKCAIEVYRNAGNSWRPWSTCGGCGCC